MSESTGKTALDRLMKNPFQLIMAVVYALVVLGLTTALLINYVRLGIVDKQLVGMDLVLVLLAGLQLSR